MSQDHEARVNARALLHYSARLAHRRGASVYDWEDLIASDADLSKAAELVGKRAIVAMSALVWGWDRK